MRSEQIAAEIESLELQANQMSERATKLLLTASIELGMLAESWIDEEVARQIEHNAEEFQKLGRERVAALKAKVAALRERVSPIVSSLIADTDRWPHRRLDPDDRQSHSSREFEYFDGLFRQTIEHLGPILVEFGLTGTRRGYMPSWEPAEGGRVRYTINPGFNSQKMPTFQPYYLLQHEIKRTHTTIQQKRREFEAARARELYDSA
jgi:hypothetical protein